MIVKRFSLFLLSIFLGLSTLFSQYSEEDWKERDEWMNVPALFEFLDIGVGDRVADVGCHEGYFTFHLSNKVGDTGKVYAVDVREYRLKNLKDHIQDRKATNIEVILGDYDDPKLPENTLDAILVVDTYHEMEDYKEILTHLKKALKPDGQLLILEKLKEHKRDKNRSEQVEAHTLSPKFVKKELEEAGFIIVKEIHDFGKWKNEGDKTMWILVAKNQMN